MRIAIVGPYFWPQVYGIEKVMYAHAKHLAARGHDVLVVSSRLRFPRGIESDLPAAETRDGFRIRRLRVLVRSLPFVHYPSRGGLLVPGLRKALGTFRPEVIHAHNIGAAAWALGSARYARASGSALFYSTHHHPNRLRFDAVRKSVIRAMNDLPLRSAAKIYHLTSRDFEIFPADYRYAPRDRFAVLANGVDPPTAPANRNTRSPLDVLFVGRVDDTRKGFAVLEAAIDALPANVRGLFVLTVVGFISDATRLRLETKYGAAIRIRGPVPESELEGAYAAAHIFAMPSLYEGFGMPYIEAMRYGVPVIGSTSGGTPEIVPATTGILAPPGDVSAVSAALTRLVTEPQLRTRMGAAGEAWSRRFHWSAIIDGLEADYQRALTTLAPGVRQATDLEPTRNQNDPSGNERRTYR